MSVERSQSSPRRVVIATSNPGKRREFTRLLAPLGCEVLAQSEFDVEPVEESGETFIENALLKAARRVRHPAFPPSPTIRA